MGLSLKERLAAMPDLCIKVVTLACAKEVTVTIRRLSMKERETLLSAHKVAKDAESGDIPKASSFTRELVALGLDDPHTSADELADLPAMVIDELSELVLDFNGWSPKGRAALADQFRPES